MAESYNVLVKVVSQKGTCNNGHKVGDEWLINRKTPEGICLGAFGSLHPWIQALIFGAEYPWLTDPDVVTVACPDAKNALVYEIRRLRE